MWGTLATGIFAVQAIGGTAGLLEGNATQVGVQALAVVVTIGYCGAATLVILKVLDGIPGLGLRVPEHDEAQGMDITTHGERAYVQDGAD